MVNEDSPVRDFYPVDFETDLNGKQMEWEAVVLIPFIDEERLLQAMKPCSVYLNDEVHVVKDLWCSSTVRLLSTQI